MTTLTIDFSAVAGLQAAFEGAVEVYHDELLRAAEENNTLLRESLEAAPAQESLSRKEVYGTSFVSDQQRRWFFAALRSGDLQVPYVRSEELAQSWTSAVQVSAEGVEGQVWTELPSARYVEDSVQQSLMLPYWQTVQSVSSEAHDAMIYRYAEAARNTHRRMFARMTSE